MSGCYYNERYLRRCGLTVQKGTSAFCPSTAYTKFNEKTEKRDGVWEVWTRAATKWVECNIWDGIRYIRMKVTHITNDNASHHIIYIWLYYRLCAEQRTDAENGSCACVCVLLQLKSTRSPHSHCGSKVAGMVVGKQINTHHLSYTIGASACVLHRVLCSRSFFSFLLFWWRFFLLFIKHIFI